MPCRIRAKSPDPKSLRKAAMASAKDAQTTPSPKMALQLEDSSSKAKRKISFGGATVTEINAQFPSGKKNLKEMKTEAADAILEALKDHIPKMCFAFS